MVIYTKAEFVPRTVRRFGNIVITRFGLIFIGMTIRCCNSEGPTALLSNNMTDFVVRTRPNAFVAQMSSTCVDGAELSAGTSLV